MNPLYIKIYGNKRLKRWVSILNDVPNGIHLMTIKKNRKCAGFDRNNLLRKFVIYNALIKNQLKSFCVGEKFIDTIKMRILKNN